MNHVLAREKRKEVSNVIKLTAPSDRFKVDFAVWNKSLSNSLVEHGRHMAMKKIVMVIHKPEMIGTAGGKRRKEKEAAGRWPSYTITDSSLHPCGSSRTMILDLSPVVGDPREAML